MPLTGGVADAGSLTVGVFLDQWLAGHVPSLKPSTAKSYREVVQWYVQPRNRPSLPSTRSGLAS